jgi:hypothetical protein
VAVQRAPRQPPRVRATFDFLPLHTRRTWISAPRPSLSRKQERTTTTTMAFGGGNNKLLDQIFNLKFTSKQLVRASKKCETEEKEEKNKVRRPEALEVGTRASS